jgi:hypothetical protein
MLLSEQQKCTIKELITWLTGAMLFLVEILQDSPRFLSSRMTYIKRSQAASTNETLSILAPLTLGSFSNRLAMFS